MTSNVDFLSIFCGDILMLFDALIGLGNASAVVDMMGPSKFVQFFFTVKSYAE